MREHHSRRGSGMDHRRSPSGRPKRPSRSPDGGRYWDCSVCTFRNNAEAFKCDMCDTRKGTSTRKPRINAQLVAQQQAQQYLAPQLQQAPKVARSSTGSSSSSGVPPGRRNQTKRRPRLKNVDRSSGVTTQVVVNNIPILITEYAPKSHTRTSPPEDDRGDSSSDQSTSQVNGV